MSNPRIRKFREAEDAILKSSRTEFISYKDFNLKRYEWGVHNNRSAFLVHGWEGHSGNFASLIPVLLEADYRVISIDAPSHGHSSIGRTNMFEFSEILISQFEKEKPQLILSHSFGSVNVGRVLTQYPELKTKLWVLVTTPNNFKSRINELSSNFNLSKRVTKKLIQKIEEDVSERIDDLNMVTYCREIFNLEKAIIIHSKSDKVLPIKNARAVNRAFKQSKLIELDNYGHYSILWSEELMTVLKNELI